MAVLWALLGAVLVALYLLGTRSFGHFRHQDVPFDRPLPFLGNMWPALRRRKPFAETFKEMYDRLRPGNPVIGFFEFMKPVYIVCDPEVIKCITTKDAEYFLDHRSAITMEIDPLIGRGLVSLQGERWKRMRATLSPSFTASKMRAMSVLVAECSRQMADHVNKRCETAEGGTLSLELKDLFTRYANDVIATCAFGVRVDSLEDTANEFYAMGKTAVDGSGKRLLAYLGFTIAPYLMKKLGFTLLPAETNKFFRTLINETIAAREQHNIVRPDMIHLLMQARESADPPLTEEDITAQAILFFLAGFETSSTNLSFLCFLLAAHPDVQKRAQREVDQTLAAHGGEVTWEALHEMKYLDTVISETLRLYPPSMLTDRKCIKPYVIEGTDTHAGIRLKEDKAQTMMRMNSKLANLQARHDHASAESARWESAVAHVKEVAALKKLELEQVRSACRNVYKQVCRAKGVPPEAGRDDYETQLELIKTTLPEMKKVVRIAQRRAGAKDNASNVVKLSKGSSS